jgi:hypothetical protein
MSGRQVHDRMRHHRCLKILGQPIGRKAIDHERMLLATDRAVIEIRGGAGVADGARPIDLDELEPMGNDELASAAGGPAILHGVLQIEQRPDVFAVVCLVY